MSNLKSADITDRLVKKIVNADESYLDRADSALYVLASKHGVATADLETDSLPLQVKDWLKCYVGYWVCADNMGLTEELQERDDIVFDPYGKKFKFYEKELEKYTNAITPEILKGEADTPIEHAYSFGRIVRS